MPSFSADDFTKIKERLDQIRKDEPIQSPVTTPSNTPNITTQEPSPDAANADYYGCGFAVAPEDQGDMSTQPYDYQGDVAVDDNSTYTQEQAMQDILDNYKRQAEKYLSERSVGLTKVQEEWRKFRLRAMTPDYTPHNLDVND